MNQSNKIYHIDQIIIARFAILAAMNQIILS